MFPYNDTKILCISAGYVAQLDSRRLLRVAAARSS